MDGDAQDEVAALSEALALVGECGLASLEDLGLASDAEELTSSEDGQSGSSASTSLPIDTTTTTPKTKVGRPSGQSQKEELAYLRATVAQLEQELALLKGPQTEGEAVVATPLAHVWEDIATRQLQERRRSEAENTKLWLLMEEQLRVARSFERLLKKRSLAEFLGPSVSESVTRMRLADAPETVSDGIWDELRSMYAEVDGIVSSNRFSSTVLPFRDIHVRTDEVFGTVVEAVEMRIAPFELQELAAATWHQMAHHTHADGEIHHGHHVHLGDDRFKRDFVVQLDSTRVKASFTGNIVAQRFVEEDRVVFVWISTMKPADSSRGVEGMRQKAYVVLTKDPEQNGEPVTLLKALLLFQPIRSGNIQQKRAVGALTNFVLTSVSFHFEEAKQNVENALLQKPGRSIVHAQKNR